MPYLGCGGGTEIGSVSQGRKAQAESLIQFRPMNAEYNTPRSRKEHRGARPTASGLEVVNVLGGAPLGFRYVRRSDGAEARCEIDDDEAVVRTVPTSTAKARWDSLNITWGRGATRPVAPRT